MNKNAGLPNLTPSIGRCSVAPHKSQLHRIQQTLNISNASNHIKQ